MKVPRPTITFVRNGKTVYEDTLERIVVPHLHEQVTIFNNGNVILDGIVSRIRHEIVNHAKSDDCQEPCHDVIIYVDDDADMIEKVRQEYKTEVARLTKLVWDFIDGYRHCGKPLETRMIESGYPKPAAAPKGDEKP